ncbi:MAG: hypothetical protein Q8N61_03330 [bacterium]|nr:hypothetical protein [bacterium]
MINLLPPEEKKGILIRKKLKLVLIFELGILLFSISALFIVFSMAIYLNGEINSEKISVFQKEEDIDLTTIADFQKETEALNKKIKNVESFYNKQTYLIPILEKISGKLPSRSYLNNFSFTKSSETSKINLSGFISTRDDLLAFKRNIESDKDFKNVSFPPGNWVSPTDIEFFLSFELK